MVKVPVYLPLASSPIIWELGGWILNVFVCRVVKLDQVLFILIILCSLQSGSILKRKGLLGLSPLLPLKLNVDYLTVSKGKPETVLLVKC